MNRSKEAKRKRNREKEQLMWPTKFCGNNNYCQSCILCHVVCLGFGVLHTVGENIIGAPKIQNNYGALQLLIFPILRYLFLLCFTL